ncbi:methionine--tRNA ligase [bacterium]|nr:methionine--tRNA ligase [bacterium]
MTSNYYVTTPIYYANGHPHLGNTYTTTLADMLTRFYKFMGKETFFLTGTDEHGDKVHQAAVKAGKTPQAFTDDVSNLFISTWKELGFEYDRFIRTTDEDHKELVKTILQQIYDQGDIYFGEYGGLYCVGCERFLTEKELIDGKCPDHQTAPQFVEEKNYFFKMSKYQDRLIKHLTEVQPDFIRPERYRNEVLALLREPLEDLCISRPKSRLTWGIELPFDPNYVTYVWFDALINYLTGVNYPGGKNYQKFWKNCEHLIAKDIVKPHGVFWPLMLMAANIPLYEHLTVHGYWITPTGKMSKTVGNVVNPLEIKTEFGMDVFRYYIFREMVFGLDGTFSRESLETRYNADLANNLGNLVSRSLAMCTQYRESKVPTATKNSAALGNLPERAEAMVKESIALFEDRELHRALERIWAFIDEVNIFIDRTKPWGLAKEEKLAQTPNTETLDAVLYSQLESIRIIAAMISFSMPETSKKIFKMLGFDEKSAAKEATVKSALEWGRLQSSSRLGEITALFPRIEKKKIVMEQTTAASQTTKEVKSEQTTETGLIEFDDFAKVSLRVGQILEASRIEKSDKLLKLKVDLGEQSGPRQILAGIGKHYDPEALVGRKVCAVTNLKPRKMLGHESQGMLLAASDEAGRLELVSPGTSLLPGSRIS